MTDTIRGPVIKIIDGDTFDMKVTHTGKDNKNKYNDEERIRIEGIDAPELGTPAGQKAKDDLERKYAGKEVRCYIQTRDDYGRLIAEVKVIG